MGTTKRNMRWSALSSFASGALWFVPSALLLLIVVVYPVLRTLELSLVHNSLATGFQMEFAGLDNFSRLAADSRFHASLWTTTRFTLYSVSAEFIIGLLLALGIQSMARGRTLARVICFLPWTLPTAIIAVLWAWIFNDQYGALNAALMNLGLISAPIAWLAQPSTAMIAIIVADVWKTAPFVFIVLLAGLQNIPQDLYEAIAMDGGGAWAKFRFVTWPHLVPFVFVAGIFRIVQAFAVFDLVWVMTGGGPGGATETISTYTYQTYMRYLDFGYGSAIIVTTVALLAVTAAVLHRILMTRHVENY